MTQDNLWENLYWHSELTRPDRLAKVLNSIIRKENSDGDLFVYDRQAAKDAMKVDLTQKNISQTGMMQHDISEIDLSTEDTDQTDLSEHNVDHLNSLKQYGDRAHMTQHDKQRLGQFDKLFHYRSGPSSSSNFQNHTDDSKGEFELFGKFKLGGSSRIETQTQSESLDNQGDVTDKRYKTISDTDMLKTTHIDKEQSAGARINNNTLNQVEINANNLNMTNMNKDANMNYTLTRDGVKKFLREFFNNVYLDGSIIKPRPISTRLIRVGKLNTSKTLFSTIVLVRMRPNIYKLPLRCESSDNGGKSKIWLSDRVDRIESLLLNLSNHVSMKGIKSLRIIMFMYLIN
jgi:hypothetical protein